MDPRTAKLATLSDLIGAMDEHMLGPVAAKAKAKQAPPVPPMAPAAPEPADAADAKPADEEMDADTAAKLRKLYEEDEDLEVAPAVPMA